MDCLLNVKYRFPTLVSLAHGFSEGPVQLVHRTSNKISTKHWRELGTTKQRRCRTTERFIAGGTYLFVYLFIYLHRLEVLHKGFIGIDRFRQV